MSRRAVRGIHDDAKTGEAARKRGDEIVQILAVEAGIDDEWLGRPGACPT
jgi:hypothetical protein